MSTPRPVIELRGVSKRFDGITVLDALDLTVWHGETVVIFGPGGCGKTTLLKICDGLVKPDSGRVIIDGQDITQLGERAVNQVRKKCGMLFQYYALFDSMTIEENVGFFLKQHLDLGRDEVVARVNKYLGMVNLEGSNSLKPLELSGGMQKRVGIARALIHEPDIVFYDSPTDGLDPVTADVVTDMMMDLNRRHQTTALVISNDMNTVFKIADRAGMLYNGKLILMDTPDAIRSTNDPYVYQFIHGLEDGPITQQ